MNEQAPNHIEAKVVELATQVAGLDAADREIKSELRGLSETVATGFRELTSKLDAGRVTPWATIISLLGLILMGMTTVGWLARQPIADGVVDLRAEQLRNAELRRVEDNRIRERQDRIADQMSYMRGQFDMLMGARK